MRLLRAVLHGAVAALLLLASGYSVWSQSTDAAAATAGVASSQDSLRILFDSRGGFKLYHLDSADNTYHPLLNPSVDAPVNLEIWRNGSPLALRVVEGASAVQEGDPGFRGPAFTADDITVQLWGLDLSATDSSWSAVRYEITNNGSAITTLTIRFILDTWLGESGREPLALYEPPALARTPISDEVQQAADGTVRVVASVKPDNTDSLYLLLPAKDWPHQVPQRMIAANVRRLQNTGPGFEVESHRAFNLLPFSINDSAVALLHDSEVLLPRQRIAIDILVSPRLDAASETIERVRQRLDAIKVSRVGAAAAESVPSQAMSESRSQLVERINRMLERLNAIWATGKYRQGDVENLIQAIDDAQKQLQVLP